MLVSKVWVRTMVLDFVLLLGLDEGGRSFALEKQFLENRRQELERMGGKLEEVGWRIVRYMLRRRKLITAPCDHQYLYSYRSLNKNAHLVRTRAGINRNPQRTRRGVGRCFRRGKVGRRNSPRCLARR